MSVDFETIRHEECLIGEFEAEMRDSDVCEDPKESTSLDRYEDAGIHQVFVAGVVRGSLREVAEMM